MFKVPFLKKHKRLEAAGVMQDDEQPVDPNQITELELTKVDHYDIVAKIGSGGMGIVYKAIDRERDLTVAIKVLLPRYDDRRGRKKDYLGREVMIAASLSHPNIIRLHREIIVQPDRAGNMRRCLLMEYVDGSSLRKHISDQDLTLKQRVDICKKLCMGLMFLHQNNVVHRDIKPENFLLTRDLTQVKICDFGLSKVTSGLRGWFEKEAGGTRKYMSPEQLKKRRLDARSDIFSFGITMYELLTGTHPCTGDDNKNQLRQIVDPKFRFDSPSKRNQQISTALDRIVLKALRRDPNHRYQSVAEILLDLERIGESRI
jgi:serine/threonine-protein kinase